MEVYFYIWITKCLLCISQNPPIDQNHFRFFFDFLPFFFLFESESDEEESLSLLLLDDDEELLELLDELLLESLADSFLSFLQNIH